MITDGLRRPPVPHAPWWAGRAALLVAAVFCAYWLSLATLWRGLAGQTPLAFVGLAPFLAVALLLAGLGRRAPLPTPGRVDLITGLALVAAAAVVLVLAPSLASIYFWTARLDVASLPLFAAGALILLFGWRVLFVSRGALALLLLAWPLPYLVLIENTGELLTQVTSGALSAVTAIVPIAAARPGGEAVFTVAYGPNPFPVQVATACAGLNSTVAFLLVGTAFILLLKGRTASKIAWFVAGATLTFALNVLRVVLLVGVGALFGPEVALAVFHPVAGVVALIVALVVMLALLPRFGLAVPEFRPTDPIAAPLPAPDTSASRLGLATRAGLIAVIAVIFGAVNGTFAAYDASPFQSNGVATSPFARASGMLAGWNVGRPRDIVIGRPYYGADSTWTRYRLWAPETRPAESRYTVWLDDVVVTDQRRLADFGVEKCYQFHGHSVDAAEPVALGGGVVGRIITVTRAAGSQWVVLWWEWPIDVDGVVQHERIVLLANASANPTPDEIAADGRPLVLLDFGKAIPADLRPLATDLTALASRVVAEQATTTAAAR